MLWHPIYFFSFCLFNSLYYYCSYRTDDFTFAICFCLPMTHSDSVLIRRCDSVLVLLFRDSLWLSYLMLTQDESSTVLWLTMSRLLIVYNPYCLHDSLFSNTIKYRRLWSLRPQTWLLVSYGTTAKYIPLFIPLAPKSRSTQSIPHKSSATTGGYYSSSETTLSPRWT